MAHDTHAAAHAHDSHAHDSHASHAPAVDDGSAGGPGGWPVALIVGIGYFAAALVAFFAH